MAPRRKKRVLNYGGTFANPKRPRGAGRKRPYIPGVKKRRRR